MNKDFPNLVKAITMTISVEKDELTQEEAEHLRRTSPQSLEYYETMKHCKSENVEKEASCIMQTFPKTSCKSQTLELYVCMDYLKKKREKGKQGVEGFCVEQDRSFSKCIEDLTFPLMKMRLGLW